MLEGNQGSIANEGSAAIGKDMLYGIVIAVLAGLLVISVFTSGFGIVKAQASCPVLNVTANETAQPAPPIGPTLTVGVGSMPVAGQSSAPVTLVEFSDYQCPYCARLYSQTETQIRTNYVDTGKAKLYFRDMPLSFHPNALPAALAAGCAGAQGKFWEMHDKLFSSQSAWSGSSDAKAAFTGYGTEIGLDAAAFASCYDAQTPLSDITSDASDAQAYGVSGTPAIFIIIPKNKIELQDLTGTVDSLNNQYGGEAVALYENDNEYIALIMGAYPYSTFDAILSQVNY